MKQRAMIAMALACMPGLLIADEPTTALDVIVQAQILRLFKDLRDKIRSMSILFISHDLSVVVNLCDKLLVMYAGKAAEWGETRAILANPLHPYTRLLVGCTPNINGQEMQFESIAGSPPDMLRLPRGCVFHPRCPHAWELCRAQEPQFLEVERNHFAACHLAAPKGDLIREK
jgi:oligopeptide/dipeptide ABC transporter ATP-binding protein